MNPISKGRKVEVFQPDVITQSPNLLYAMREKLIFFNKKNGENLVQNSAYLLFCLIKLDCDVPLETHITGIIKHPKTGNNNRVQNSEAHTDNSVLRNS